MPVPPRQAGSCLPGVCPGTGPCRIFHHRGEVLFGGGQLVIPVADAEDKVSGCLAEGIFEDLLGRPFFADLALVHEEDPVGDVFG